MPADQVFNKFKGGRLHSGSKKGPIVGNRKQAVAIYLSEKGKAGGNPAANPDATPPAEKPIPIKTGTAFAKPAAKRMALK